MRHVGVGANPFMVYCSRSTMPRCVSLVRSLGETRRIIAPGPLSRRETSMDETSPPDVPLSQSLAVLRQCITTLDTATARAPTVVQELQDTVSALRGVEAALHQHRDALRRAYHFATLGRLAAGLTHEIRNPLGVLFLHIDLLEEEFRPASAREPAPHSPDLQRDPHGPGTPRCAGAGLSLPGAGRHHRTEHAGLGRGHAGVDTGDA